MVFITDTQHISVCMPHKTQDSWICTLKPFKFPLCYPKHFGLYLRFAEPLLWLWFLWQTTCVWPHLLHKHNKLAYLLCNLRTNGTIQTHAHAHTSKAWARVVLFAKCDHTRTHSGQCNCLIATINAINPPGKTSKQILVKFLQNVNMA